jgi:hypothetical protein
VLGRLNMASCEDASSQVGAEKVEGRAEEKLDELVMWHTFR